MKFLKLIYLAILSASLNVSAEYVNTFTNSSEKDWVDTSTKEGIGNIRRISELRNFKEVQIPKQGFEHYSKLHVYEFNCSQRTFKVLFTAAFEKHHGAGKAVFRDDTPTPTYIQLRDGTSSYEAMKIACN